jgi:hypothetical protein
VPGDLLDVILVVLAAAFAVDGYRQGFVVGALGVIGFLSGAAAGALLAPGIAQALVRSPSQQALVAIVVVFVVALAGQLLASLAGAALRSRLAWRPATVMDAAGGAAVSAMSVLLIAWFIGSARHTAGTPLRPARSCPAPGPPPPAPARSPRSRGTARSGDAGARAGPRQRGRAGHVRAAGRQTARRQRPVKAGGRFSAKARWPSR